MQFQVLFLCFFAQLISAMEIEAEAKAEPSLPQEEDLTSPTDAFKPIVGAGAAVTLPFVFESSSPIQPIMVEVKPDDRKDRPEVPPRQTKPWLGDVIIADDQGEFKPILTKGLVAVLPFPFRPSTKPWFVDDQSTGAVELRPIVSQNGAAVTLPATLGGLRGAPQLMAPEEDLTSPLPGASPAPVAVAVPLPYVLNRPRPQQKPLLVAVQMNDDSGPIGFTRPVFPDGAPVAAVRPDTNKVVGVSTLPFTFEKPSGSAVPIRQTKPLIVDQQPMFVPIRQTRPFLTQPVKTLPFNFNNENQEAVPIRQTKPWFVDSSSNFNTNEGFPEAQPNNNMMGFFIHQSICFCYYKLIDYYHLNARPFITFSWMNRFIRFKRHLSRACCFIYRLPKKMELRLDSTPIVNYLSLNFSPKSYFFKKVHVNAVAQLNQVSPNRKKVKHTVSPGPNPAANEASSPSTVRAQQVTTAGKQSQTEVNEELEETSAETLAESAVPLIQSPSLAVYPGKAEKDQVKEETKVAENIDEALTKNGLTNKPTETAKVTVTQTKIRSAYCFAMSLNEGTGLAPCPLRRKRADLELEDMAEVIVNEKLVKPSEIAEFLMTESPSYTSFGSLSDMSEILSSMKSPDFFEIKELGSPTMERLLQSPNDSSTTTIEVFETVTQTIRLLAGNCVPQCLYMVSKCKTSSYSVQ